MSEPSSDGPSQVTPRLNDDIHFTLYYSTLPDGSPDPNPDPSIVGQCRGGWVSFVHEDGAVDLNYQTGRQPNEPDNPPNFIEHKIRRYRDPSGAPGINGTWHYVGECPYGR